VTRTTQPTVVATVVQAPRASGQPGTPAGGLPEPRTLTSRNLDVGAVAELTAYYSADTVLDRRTAATRAYRCAGPAVASARGVLRSTGRHR